MHISKQLSSIGTLLNDSSLTEEKIKSFGATKLAEWNGDDKDRDISLDKNYVIITKGKPGSRCHSIIFCKNSNGYYEPEIYKV